MSRIEQLRLEMQNQEPVDHVVLTALDVKGPVSFGLWWSTLSGGISGSKKHRNFVLWKWAQLYTPSCTSIISSSYYACQV